MAPATARNRQHITKVLRHHLPSRGLVLEVASGRGEHITHFAAVLSPISDFSQAILMRAQGPASTRGFTQPACATSCRPSLSTPRQTLGPFNARIRLSASTWFTSRRGRLRSGLCAAQRVCCPPMACFYLYGPYRRDGRHTAPSNEAFDGTLRRQNPNWGVRDLEAVAELADEHGFARPLIEEMPANNLSLVFHRVAPVQRSNALLQSSQVSRLLFPLEQWRIARCSTFQ
jgi:hypothetical protein